MSSIAWYEFSRGPRSPEQLAVARSFFGDEGIIAFDEDLAVRAGEQFRQLGSPRARAADIAIGVTASRAGAVLLTRNARDFDGVVDLVVEGMP
jgi:predicted nucleic acid-binding protein